MTKLTPEQRAYREQVAARAARAEFNAANPRCNRCGERRPLAEFGRDAYAPGGHSRFCLTCGRAYRRERAATPRN